MKSRIVIKEILLPILGCTTILLVLFFNCTIDKTCVFNRDGLKIYADSEDSIYVDEIAKKSVSLLHSKGVTNISSTIILCKTKSEYNRKTLYLKKGSLGVALTFFHFIIMSPADLENNLQDKMDDRLVQRPLSSSIAHEMTHISDMSELGIFNFIHKQLFHNWKLEGHAEYVAESSSFNVDLGKKILLYEDPETTNKILQDGLMSVTYWYYLCRLRTVYLLDVKKMSIDEFLTTDINENELDSEIKEYITSNDFNISQN